jgi:PAS domain S-box-containing protein
MMTTTRKLWIGFGLVIAILAISSMVILVNAHTIERDVQRMSEARTYSSEIRRLHVNVLQYALDFRAYLQWRSPAVRADAIESAKRVDELLLQHSQRGMDEEHRELVDRFSGLWGELEALGTAMMLAADERPDAGSAVSEEFLTLRTKINTLLESEIQPLATAAYDQSSMTAVDGIVTIQNTVLLLMVVGTLIASAIGLLVTRTIVHNENKILSASEWLRVTLLSIGDGVITTDGQGRVTFLNPVAERLTGWTQADASSGPGGAGVPIEQVFHIVNESSRAIVENPASRALREGVIVGLANHTVLISKSGTEISIDDSGAPIRGTEGKIAGAVLVFRDVSEHKKREKIIQDAFEYASNILETQREPFLVLDKDLSVVSANRSFYQTFQAEPDTTIGRFVYDLGDGQWNIPRLRELLEEVLPLKNAFDGFEVSHDFPGGVGEKTMKINARRVRTLEDDSEHILLAIEDVTDREFAQRAQRDSEVRFRRLFETAKDGILILDVHTRKITDANAFMCGLTGLESGELLGKELFEIGMYKDVEENKDAFHHLLRTGYLRHDHLPIKNRGGGKVEVEFIANVYREGERLVAQCNVRDISERNRLEREVSKQAEALAAQSKGKDEFLAMLSHELRNPLAPIRAAVQLLRINEPADALPVQQQAREIIERQVANLTRMVSDLLEVSRVVSGRIQLDLKPLDIKRIIAHAVQSTAVLFEQRSHIVEVNLCDEPVWALADATRLEEVLVNLLNNAAKYTPDGGHIVVTCERGPERGAICVIDNGVGIDKELLPRIFDLFTQADRSLARSAGGLGIGLSLANRLVGQHGGTIEANSEGPGKGSQFIVKLPLIEQPPAVTPSDVAHAPIEPSRLASAVRVLVVDDNVDLVTMLASVLRHKGYSVRSAHTGPDGLLIAQQWQPDITLLDIGLPGLDGYEVAKRLRAAALTPGEVGERPVRMRLLALTGYGRDADIVLALESGFDGHLVKPCDMDELERLMTAPLK